MSRSNIRWADTKYYLSFNFPPHAMPYFNEIDAHATSLCLNFEKLCSNYRKTTLFTLRSLNFFGHDRVHDDEKAVFWEKTPNRHDQAAVLIAVPVPVLKMIFDPTELLEQIEAVA